MLAAGRPVGPINERDQQLLLAAITVEHIASKKRYGSPRIHAELAAQGWPAGINRVARLMRLHGLEGRSGRLRRHSLTRQAKIAPDIPDLLKRDFTAEQPDTMWVTDIERHEAPLRRAEVKGLRGWPVAAGR